MNASVTGSNAPTAELVNFVRRMDFASLPLPVRHECTRAFVDAMGCTLGGARHPLVEIAHGALSEFFGAPQASLLGRGKEADLLHAALLNGLAGAAYSFFDTYSDALLHPSGPVLAALLALAERTPVSGEAFLGAFAAGLEVACRLTKCIAVPPAESPIAWSQTGIACGVATALAAGKLLNLDENRLTWALGIAASEASGTRITHGSMAASLIFGHAAQTGLRAALLAERGFTSSAASIEGRFGFTSVFARIANTSALVADLGKNYELLLNMYKPFPCGIVLHPAIDAMLQLRLESALVSSDIEHITAFVSKNAVELGSRPNPQDDLDAKFSIQHWVAAAAVSGSAGIREGSSAAVNDTEIRRIRAVTDVKENPSFSNDCAQIIVELKDGTRRSTLVEHCLGSVERPMSDEDLEIKFIGQAEIIIGAARAQDLVATCWSLETLPDVASICSKTYSDAGD